jgi:Family of unknown function (DUF5856)
MTDKGESYKYAKYKTKYLQSKQSGGEQGNLQDITIEFFSHLIMIKMLHFQSTKYAAHKALDDYYDSFNEKMDRLMEALQGDRGRILVYDNALYIQVNLVDDATITERLDRFRSEVLIELINSRYSSNSGVISVRDDMIVDLDLLQYLLTFQ